MYKILFLCGILITINFWAESADFKSHSTSNESFRFQGVWINTTYFDSSVIHKTIAPHTDGILGSTTYISFMNRDSALVWGLFWGIGHIMKLSKVTDSTFTIFDDDGRKILFKYDARKNILRAKSEHYKTEETFRRDDRFSKYLTSSFNSNSKILDYDLNSGLYFAEQLFVGDYTDILTEKRIRFSSDSTNFWQGILAKYSIYNHSGTIRLFDTSDGLSLDFNGKQERFIWEFKCDTLKIYTAIEDPETEEYKKADLYSVLVRKKQQ